MFLCHFVILPHDMLLHIGHCLPLIDVGFIKKTGSSSSFHTIVKVIIYSSRKSSLYNIILLVRYGGLKYGHYSNILNWTPILEWYNMP